MTLDSFRFILDYSLTGMGIEVQKMQIRVLQLKQFGDNAVLHPEIGSPLRHNPTIEELERRIKEKCALIRETQELLDRVKDIEIEQFHNDMREYFSNPNR